MTPIVTIGLSYKTVPVEIREQFAFGQAEIVPTVAALHAIPGVDECLLLSTCNRTEVYVVAPADPPVPQVLSLLRRSRTISPASGEAPFYVHQGSAAARHALRVTAGLDSMILGEDQILGQFRHAYSAARTAEAIGPVLNRLMQIAIATGRRVHRETRLSQGAPSVPRAALALCQRVLGSVHGKRVVVVGAGALATLVIKWFAGSGMQVVAVANRTPETARSVAVPVGAEAVALDGLPAAARSADILVVCAAVPGLTLFSDGHNGVQQRRDPPLVIDLGIPRSIDPKAPRWSRGRVYTLDDLAPIGLHPASPDDLPRAERIIDDAVAGFERWMAARSAAPLLAALQHQTKAILDREWTRSQARLAGLDDRQHQVVRSLVEAAMRKLLHGPIVRLQQAAARHDTRVLEVAQELFDLAGKPSGPRRRG